MKKTFVAPVVEVHPLGAEQIIATSEQEGGIVVNPNNTTIEQLSKHRADW